MHSSSFHVHACPVPPLFIKSGSLPTQVTPRVTPCGLRLLSRPMRCQSSEKLFDRVDTFCVTVLATVIDARVTHFRLAGSHNAVRLARSMWPACVCLLFTAMSVYSWHDWVGGTSSRCEVKLLHAQPERRRVAYLAGI